jgi:hypothetical protein
VRTHTEKLEEIVDLARACREAQRRYLQRRDHESLVDAKEQERMLDDALAWLDEGGSR